MHLRQIVHLQQLLISIIQEIAEKIYERHTLISNWLIHLGVDPKIAAEDACRIEHVISEESFAAMKAHAVQET